MDPYLQILINIMLLISGIIVLILAAIIFMRLQAANNEIRFGRWAKEWEAYFLDYMLGDSTLADIPSNLRKQFNPNWLRRFFTPYLEALDGPDFEVVKALCRETGLIDYYRKELVRISLYKKAVAAKFLGQLRCKESAAERLKMLESKNVILVLAAAQGLAVSGEPGTFQPVLRVLLKDTYITYEGVTELVSRFGRQICKPITTMLDSYSKNEALWSSPIDRQKGQKISASFGVDRSVFIIILIDLLGHYRYHEATPVLVRMIEKADIETIIHILKAFLRIGRFPDELSLKPYLLNEHWVVRNFAAQAAELTRDEEVITLLDQLLADEQWWVRYHAAKALFSFGEAGKSILDKGKYSTNNYVSGICRYLLALKEVG